MLPLVALARSKQDSVKRGHGALYLCRPPPAGALEVSNALWLQGKEYRYAYSVSAKLPASFSNALAKFDVKEGTAKQWHEAGCSPLEPIMVPRPGAKVWPSRSLFILSLIPDCVIVYIWSF